jgi:hypothetical protein
VTASSNNIDANFVGGLNEGTFSFTFTASDVTEGVLLSNQLDGSNSTVISIGASVDSNGWGPGMPNYSGVISEGHIFFDPYNGGPSLKSLAVLEASIEYSISITFSQTSASLYINGVKDTTVFGDFSTPSLNGSVAAVGDWVVEGGTIQMMAPFAGTLNEVSIYDAENAQLKGALTMTKSMDTTATTH